MDNIKPKVKHGWKSSKRQDRRDKFYEILLRDLKKDAREAGVINDE